MKGKKPLANENQQWPGISILAAVWNSSVTQEIDINYCPVI